MQTFLDLTIILMLLMTCGSNLIIFLQLHEVDGKIDKLVKYLDEIDEIYLKSVKMSGQLDSIQAEIHRSMLAIRSPLEATKPIKTNNWNSMKEAFKGPVRINVDERD